MPTYYVVDIPYSIELYHHGIKGQRWGVRRFRNEDGTLTPQGKARYGSEEHYENKRKLKEARRNYNRSFNKMWNRSDVWHNITKKQRAKAKQAREELSENAQKYREAKSAYKDSKKVFKTSEVKQARASERVRRGKRFLTNAAASGIMLASVASAMVAANSTTKIGARAVAAITAGAGTTIAYGLAQRAEQKYNPRDYYKKSK